MEQREQQETAVVPEKKQSKFDKINPFKLTLYTSVGLIIVISVFTSGWLFGSGRLQFKDNSFLPQASVKNAPNEGVDELYRSLQVNFDGELDDDEILTGIKQGMVSAAGDPFTEFLTDEETASFNDSLNGSFEGIGAELGKEGSYVIIVAPIKGMPADKAGLQPQDIIVAIDGEDAFDISVSEAVTKIRGPKGESVTLSIVRDGVQQDITIVRDTITIDSVEWELDGNIGIISISRFGNDTELLTVQAATELKDSGAENIILDLRGNPGGLLDVSVAVSSVWLPRGSTVLEEKQNGKVVQTYTTEDSPILNGMPTVVLINEGSASASEIVAGALKDNDAATLVGKQSFGKGSVQRLIPLSAGGTLKVTIARWFTPNGVNIDKEGISPDIEVEITPEDIENKFDRQLEEAKNTF